MQKQRAFTLTELIIVIVLVGILAAVVGPLVGNQFAAVAQSTDRARWVQQAEFALFHIRQDLARSVPNSHCTDTAACTPSTVIEFLGNSDANALVAARYRDLNYPGPTGDRLQINNDSSFDVFTSHTHVPNYVAINVSTAFQARTDWQAWQASSTPIDGTIAGVASSTVGTVEAPITNIVLTKNHRFRNHSPFFRAYFFDGPVAYQCDNGTLYRVSGYTAFNTSTAFATRADYASNPTRRSRITDEVVDCEFSLQPGQPDQPPSVTVKLALGNANERIQLIDTLVLGNGS